MPPQTSTSLKLRLSPKNFSPAPRSVSKDGPGRQTNRGDQSARVSSLQSVHSLLSARAESAQGDAAAMASNKAARKAYSSLRSNPFFLADNGGRKSARRENLPVANKQRKTSPIDNGKALKLVMVEAAATPDGAVPAAKQPRSCRAAKICTGFSCSCGMYVETPSPAPLASAPRSQQLALPTATDEAASDGNSAALVCNPCVGLFDDVENAMPIEHAAPAESSEPPPTAPAPEGARPGAAACACELVCLCAQRDAQLGGEAVASAVAATKLAAEDAPEQPPLPSPLPLPPPEPHESPIDEPPSPEMPPPLASIVEVSQVASTAEAPARAEVQLVEAIEKGPRRFSSRIPVPKLFASRIPVPKPAANRAAGPGPAAEPVVAEVAAAAASNEAPSANPPVAKAPGKRQLGSLKKFKLNLDQELGCEEPMQRVGKSTRTRPNRAA